MSDAAKSKTNSKRKTNSEHQAVWRAANKDTQKFKDKKAKESRLHRQRKAAKKNAQHGGTPGIDGPITNLGHPFQVAVAIAQTSDAGGPMTALAMPLVVSQPGPLTTAPAVAIASNFGGCPTFGGGPGFGHSAPVYPGYPGFVGAPGYIGGAGIGFSASCTGVVLPGAPALSAPPVSQMGFSQQGPFLSDTGGVSGWGETPMSHRGPPSESPLGSADVDGLGSVSDVLESMLDGDQDLDGDQQDLGAPTSGRPSRDVPEPASHGGASTAGSADAWAAISPAMFSQLIYNAAQAGTSHSVHRPGGVASRLEQAARLGAAEGVAEIAPVLTATAATLSRIEPAVVTSAATLGRIERAVVSSAAALDRIEPVVGRIDGNVLANSAAFSEFQRTDIERQRATLRRRAAAAAEQNKSDMDALDSSEQGRLLLEARDAAQREKTAHVIATATAEAVVQAIGAATPQGTTAPHTTSSRPSYQPLGTIPEVPVSDEAPPASPDAAVHNQPPRVRGAVAHVARLGKCKRSSTGASVSTAPNRVALSPKSDN